jgi:hypothetical protein
VISLGALAVVTACTAHDRQPTRHAPTKSTGPANGNGVVTGSAPICYGPGPDLNLHPVLTIRAIPTSGGSTIAIQVPNSAQHHAYRMTLPAGSYALAVPGDAPVAVTVDAGKTVSGIDLPEESCL